MHEQQEYVGLTVGRAPPSLVDVAYVTLRGGITSGSLAPGSRLRELALSRLLSSSAPPIRGALRRLNRNGLVKLLPDRGAIVAEFTLTRDLRR